MTSLILLVSLVVNIAAIAIAVTAYLEANSTSSSAEFAVQSQIGKEENKTSGEFPMPEGQPHIIIIDTHFSWSPWSQNTLFIPLEDSMENRPATSSYWALFSVA